jgi:hypothetical protein
VTAFSPMRNDRGPCRWASVAASAVVALGCAAWSHAARADDAPPKAAAAADSSASAAKPAATAQAAATAAQATTTAAQVTTAAQKSAAGQRPLDLTAPPVDRVLTPEQVRSFVTEPQDEGATPDDVTVESPHYLEPVPNGAFSALPWALMHPLQAWRIFAPITD